MSYSQIWQNFRGGKYLCKLGKEHLNPALCKFCTISVQHSKTSDISHAFLPVTVAKLATLKQVNFFGPSYKFKFHLLTYLHISSTLCCQPETYACEWTHNGPRCAHMLCCPPAQMNRTHPQQPWLRQVQSTSCSLRLLEALTVNHNTATMTRWTHFILNWVLH